MNSDKKSSNIMLVLGCPLQGWWIDIKLIQIGPSKCLGIVDHVETGDEANELAGMGGNSVEPRQMGELVESDLLCSNASIL